MMRTRLTAQQPSDRTFSKSNVQRRSLKSRPFTPLEDSNAAATGANPTLQTRPDAAWHRPIAPMPMFDPTGTTVPTPVQFKLTVGAPNDVYEQEADRVAGQVMSMPDSATQQPLQREAMPEEELQTKPLATAITPLVQREAMPEEEEPVQAKASGNADIQQDVNRNLQTGSNLENQLSGSKGGGSPLPDDVRSFMEPRFGADFSQVSVHTGSEAVQMNRDLNAQAFTHKQDVYFGAGKVPGKDALTAHELTHVVQQSDALMRQDVETETTATASFPPESAEGKTELIKQNVTIQVTPPKQAKVFKRFSAEATFSISPFGLSPIEFSANFKEEMERLRSKLGMTALAFKVKAQTSVDLSPLASPKFGLSSGIEGEFPLFGSKSAIFGGVGASINNKDGKFKPALESSLGVLWRF